jgi:hypothetical protein
VDSWLNRYVDDSGSRPVQSFGDIPGALKSLPRPATDRQYHLLYLDAENEELPPDGPAFRLLGHDLSDYTETSSLLNCGPWQGRLAPLAQRLNGYGLLTFDDARLAKQVLPEEWPGDPHSAVMIWALYELAPAPETRDETKARREP